MWTALHFVALGYPESPSEKEAAEYRAFFVAVGHVLPCSCAANYRLHLESDLPLGPTVLSGRRALFDWTVAMHNLVNAQTGKPAWSSDEAFAFYISGAPTTKNGPGLAGTMALATLIAAVAVGIAFLVWKRRTP